MESGVALGSSSGMLDGTGGHHRVVDLDIAGDGEEIEGGRGTDALEVEEKVMAVARPRGGEGRGTLERQQRARLAVEVRIGCMAGRDDGEGERQVCLAGHADVLADEPCGMSANGDGLAGLEIGRGLDFHREQNRPLVAIDDDVARVSDSQRERPLDRAGLETGRQCPVDGRRDAGVAGVLPVGIPARFHLKLETDGNRAGRARCHRRPRATAH